MHELEELVDYRLEELPMGFKESRILPDDIHDIGGNDSLVILPLFHFSQA
jgi:hypothetical protein